MERYGLPVEFVGGRRVTSRAALVLVRRSFAEVNGRSVRRLGRWPCRCSATRSGWRPTGALGLVGDPFPCRPPAIEQALADGLLPVVAPLAVGPLNVNADEAAAALAVGLEADRILFVSDVPGVLLDGDVAPPSTRSRPSACSRSGRSRAGSCRSCARP